MSYQAQYQLTSDSDFNGRSIAAATEQAATFVNDARPSWVALAQAVLRGETDKLAAFVRYNASAPGIADKADNGDGTVDSSKVSDADLLSLTQAGWPTIAGLYYAEDGTPIP
jgi:hypothetical protein